MSVPLLETSRLCLRPLEPRDLPWLRELLRDEDVRRLTLQPARGRIRAWLEANFHLSSADKWAIDAAGLGPCGWISFGHLDEVDTLTVGFELRRQFWNRGIMTEALQCLSGYHFAQRPQEHLGAIVFEENYASRRVLEKAAFREKGPCTCGGHRSVVFDLSPGAYKSICEPISTTWRYGSPK